MSDVNAPAALADPGMEWPEGELPEQLGGQRTTLMPGIYTFRIPANIASLWKDNVPVKDGRATLANGQPNPTYNQMVNRLQLKLDRNNPLIVIGGPHDGEPMTWTLSTNPRPRGKKDDPKTPWISDIHYLIGVGLASQEKPKTTDEIKALINRYAGGTVRLETGLTAQCNPENVRYIDITMDGQTTTMKDPSGKKGCGKRYYTNDFKDPSAPAGEPPYGLEKVCTCGVTLTEAEVAAGAAPVDVILRAFEQVERILPPQPGA
jgi:hypothetical protein